MPALHSHPLLPPHALVASLQKLVLMERLASLMLRIFFLGTRETGSYDFAEDKTKLVY